MRKGTTIRRTLFDNRKKALDLKNVYLTKSEKQIMHAFWQTDHPLSCTELLSICELRNWKDRSIFSMLNDLLDKGLLQSVGFVRIGKTYARTFTPTMSQVEYWGEVINQEHMSSSQLSELTDLLASYQRSLDLA